MAEAEEVIQDIARHATVFARDLWRRHRPDPPLTTTALRDVAQRLDHLIVAVFGRAFALRSADPPAHPTLLTKVFRRTEGPRVQAALPATDGTSIWLPKVIDPLDDLSGLQRYRIAALQQATRAVRGSAAAWASLDGPIARALFQLHEAQAADAELIQLLPGIAPQVMGVRRQALRMRPAVEIFPPHRQPVEHELRRLLQADLRDVPPLAVEGVVARVSEMAARWPVAHKGRLLYRDWWTGEFRVLPRQTTGAMPPGEDPPLEDGQRPTSATLPRRPEVREAPDDEDDQRQGAWMVQTSQPQEQAEDPVGMQRPTDRHEADAAHELADALSELPEARLVSTPGRPKEVLLSDEPPATRERPPGTRPAPPSHAALPYPEWDHTRQAYIDHGVTVHLRAALEGPQQWVDETLAQHRSLLHLVRRRFEVLRAQRARLYRQLDGEEVDIDAYIEARADFLAGQPMAQGLYQTHRQVRRDMALLILTDISGSTDGWIASHKRVVDVEREALLLVAIAMQSMGEPYALQAFSGEGPHGVVVRSIKGFREPFTDSTARRIASLEPEHYTRAGAALRHATATLMQEPARHRLLLLLSDGKPNDVDRYEGLYGVEDMRQAITEAKLQGISPFCLTVDQQAATYLSAVFGRHHYGMLPRPERLPTVLLDWMKRLVQA